MSAYRFSGYEDVARLTLMDANMDMLATAAGSNPRVTGPLMAAPSPRRRHSGKNAHVEHSVVARGCTVEGEAENSVLSERCTVEEGASVQIRSGCPVRSSGTARRSPTPSSARSCRGRECTRRPAGGGAAEQWALPRGAAPTRPLRMTMCCPPTGCAARKERSRDDERTTRHHLCL